MTFPRVRRILLNALFNLLYRGGRWLYDPLTILFFSNEWHRWRQTVLPWISEGPVLELGCGTGRLLEDLRRTAGFTVGLDLEAAMLSKARPVAAGNQIALVRGDGASLPFSDYAFKSVVAVFPSSYIASPATLGEIARVLQTGGTLVVVASAAFTRFQWRRPFIHLILRIAYGSTKSMNRWPGEMLQTLEMKGNWHDVPTEEGVAFVWVARKLDSAKQRESKVSTTFVEN